MNDFDDVISGAVTGRADGAPTDAPDFETVLAARQDRLRRRTALAAGGLVVAGLAGIGLFATAGNEAPGVAGEASSTTPGPFATTTIAPDQLDGGGETWFCTGRLFPSVDGSPGITVLETVPTTTMPAPTTTTLSPGENLDTATVGTVPTVQMETDSGYYRNCEFVGQDGSTVPTVVEDTMPPLTTTIVLGAEEARIAEEEARAQAEEAARRVASEAEARRLAEEGIATHIVEDGDDAILIAEQYCVSLDDLLDVNGWTIGAEFPSPGDLVKIPPTTVEDCTAPTTTDG